jgi:phage baseplate assembly protein W
MVKKGNFGIKYPFQKESEDKRYFDLNEDYKEKIRSDIAHLIFTPKGQRYRRPDFGTNLVKYIFEPNDMSTWDAIKEDITEQVKKYIPKVKFNNIKVFKDEENGNHLYVEIEYSIIKGKYEEKDKIMLRID